MSGSVFSFSTQVRIPEIEIAGYPVPVFLLSVQDSNKTFEIVRTEVTLITGETEEVPVSVVFGSFDKTEIYIQVDSGDYYRTVNPSQINNSSVTDYCYCNCIAIDGDNILLNSLETPRISVGLSAKRFFINSAPTLNFSFSRYWFRTNSRISFCDNQKYIGFMILTEENTYLNPSIASFKIDLIN